MIQNKGAIPISPRRSCQVVIEESEAAFRSSTLSFQCAGESLFHDEAAWLSSPLNKWNRRESEPLPHILSQSMPSERRMTSWMSDVGSCVEDEEDIFVSTQKIKYPPGIDSRSVSSYFLEQRLMM